MRKIIRIFILTFLIMIIVSVMISYKLILKNKSSIIDYKVVEEDANYDENSDEYYLKEYGLKDLSQEDKQKIRNWEIYGAYELILLMCKKKMGTGANYQYQKKLESNLMKKMEY